MSTEITYAGFNGRAARERIGESAAVVFDPSGRHFYVFTSIGSGTPSPVWHHRQVEFPVPASASLEAVEAVLRTLEATTEALAACYLGSEWDGHNHVGSWMEGYNAHLDVLEEAAKGVATYWEADNWLDGDPGAVQKEIENLLRAGKTIEEAIEERTTAEMEAAAGQNVLIDEDDMRKSITWFAEKVAEKIAEEDE